MTESDDDWTAFQTAWRSPVGEDDARATLEQRLAEERTRSIRETRAEWVASILCTVVFIWFSQNASGTGQGLLVALAILAVVWPLAMSALRRRSGQRPAETIMAYRETLRRRARLGLWLGWIGVIGGPLGLLVGFWIGGRVDISTPAGLTAEVLLTAAIVLLGMTSWWSIREIRRHRETLSWLDTASDDIG